MAPVLIFGPTGQIGSYATQTAAALGAEVCLAMRNPSKPIPNFDPSNAIRLQADLDDPRSVKSAAQTSGARRAFLYLSHGCSDNMRATFEALKAGGVDFVVFVSSFTIFTDRALRETLAKELIPYVHAQAEANLREVFGCDGYGYVALRPGTFVSNLLQYRKGIVAGRVGLYGGGFLQDNVVPADIGRVAGRLLIEGAREGEREVYVYGPEVLSMRETVVRIGRALGREVEVVELGREEAYVTFVKSGMPELLAEYMCEVLSTQGPIKGEGGSFPKYDEGVRNVELYTGKPATSLEEWSRQNVAMLS